jgi:hypothetical protein
MADYVMHRRTRIERTSGLGESVIQALMMAEISVPFMLILLCEVNPLLLGVSTAAAGVHEATAISDVRAAVDGGPEVRPAEQYVQSFLESLPFMATSALLCLQSGSPGPVRIKRTTHCAAGNLKISVTRVPQGPESALVSPA